MKELILLLNLCFIYSNSTTHFLFEPLDLLAKLAALVPRPRVNLTRYHGVFAPNSTLRAQIVPGKPRKKRTTQTSTSNLPNRTSKPETAEPTQLTWAQRLKRAFEFDVTVCPLCGATVRFSKKSQSAQTSQRIDDAQAPSRLFPRVQEIRLTQEPHFTIACVRRLHLNRPPFHAQTESTQIDTFILLPEQL
jgi:hypothetical protein